MLGVKKRCYSIKLSLPREIFNAPLEKWGRFSQQVNRAVRFQMQSVLHWLGNIVAGKAWHPSGKLNPHEHPYLQFLMVVSSSLDAKTSCEFPISVDSLGVLFICLSPLSSTYHSELHTNVKACRLRFLQLESHG